ncbi:hypothetical protein ACLI09_04330 [Flavobacterium sp. RHBU_24]|uniref:hypothetical protein n=1 Tax=Flavobacterium sp. RHBU_24 TaxID=3391185 RepID=UPI00398467CA
MKKLLFCLSVTAALTLIACSDDDNGGNAQNCVTCTLTDSDTGQSDVQQVCNQDGNAYVNNTNTGTSYTDYISLTVSAGYVCN